MNMKGSRPLSGPFFAPNLVEKFSGARVLVVGDLMLDAYVWGDVDRVSPEAPVQVVKVNKETFTLGGAGNVVNNLATLGAKVSVFGVVGDDEDGQRVRSLLEQSGVSHEGVITDKGRPTIRKTRIIAASQHVVRIDREENRALGPEPERLLIQGIRAAAGHAGVFILSDYAKGVASPNIIQCLAAAAENAGKLFMADPKARDFSKYKGAHLLTPNLKEAALAVGRDILSEEDLVDAADAIKGKVGAAHLLITLGQKGMALFQNDNQVCRIQSDARQVFDVSGAGDTVISVLGLGVAAGLPLATAAHLANIAAGIVVGKVGTATVTPKELSDAMDNSCGHGGHSGSLAETAQKVRQARQEGKTIVFTNGCFDLLHAGHIQLLKESKRKGGFLVVAIDDDESVNKLKGENRPVLSATDRVKILSALDAVDVVVVFSTHELPHLIKTLRPDILTKGGNYAPEEVEGGSLVEELGGQVILIPLSGHLSSTSIINGIRGS